MLSHAEQVILRHVLADSGRNDDLAALDRPGAWSSETVAAAVSLVRSRVADGPPDRWLSDLPDGAAAVWLRTIWSDETLRDVPWDDAYRELRRQRGRRWIARLESRLQSLAKAPSPTNAFGMLTMLLVEYKRLRSLLGEQAHH